MEIAAKVTLVLACVVFSAAAGAALEEDGGPRRYSMALLYFGALFGGVAAAL